MPADGGGALSRHAAKNRAYWDAQSDAYQERHREQIAGGLGWGIWQVPEADLRALPDVDGLDVLELGCGAAQWSIALAGRGARAVGLDISPRQLEHARAAVKEAGANVELVESSAESTPFGDASFDLIFCDHGAFNFADPELVIPEASRLLRPGGMLAFCMASPLLDLFWDNDAEKTGTELRNDYFTLKGFEDDEAVDFQLPYGAWIRLFVANDLDVVDLIEIQPPEGAETTYTLVPYGWARRWPAENIWKARKRG
jgi:SAM-dependent methyltransferase